MLNSLSITADATQERAAKSSLPWVWFGFFFVAAFFIEEVLNVALQLDEPISDLFLILIAIAGWIFWLSCVSRFHKILSEVSGNRYPISSAEAVGKHFIPFYNFVWLFIWPSRMSDYINRQARVKMLSGSLLGAFLLIFLLVGRFFDGAIGLGGIFSVGMYLSIKLRKHIQSIPGSYELPPLPDPNMFGPQTDPMPNADSAAGL